jgi:osmoprotectant transport system ATP-binding protein
MIELIKVNKYFNKGRTHAVRDVSFEIFEGETLVLLGSSGCGKTTILKMLNRLIEPSSGSIKIKGETIFDRNPIDIRRSIGYVIQGIGLFPHMNIVSNISIVLKLLGESVSNRYARAEEVLELVGLDPLQYSSRYPDELSGGQQQRVGVARALAADPAILLMDEPFGALDAVTRDLLQQELLKIKARLKKTVVFVTHDIFEAFTLADRIAVMHEGQLHQLGTKEEIIGSPKTDFVRALLMKPKKQLAQFQESL